MSDDGKEKSNRPEDSDFKQQRLPAWQPLLTPQWVIATFLLVGVSFLPIGIVIVTASNNVVEVSARYDHRADCAIGSTCTVDLSIPDDMDAPVYFYYELSNYYQNHRRYVKSRSDDQLRGDSGSVDTCTPLETGAGGQTLYPCGLIANSMFNDSFTALRCSDPVDPACQVDWTNRGIAWQSDIDHKFEFSSTLAAEGTNVAADGHVLPNVTDTNEEFIVWMRTAGLPTFRKLHRKINNDLKASSTFSVTITNTYPVDSFDGEKRIVLSTTSWLGGKNRFLGWSYIAVGVVCILTGVVFQVKHSISPRRLGDMQYFHWAGASGQPAQ